MVGFVGDGGDDDPLDHLVGVPFQELAVLEGPRLGLVGVDHEVGRPRRGQEAPLEPGREGSSAPPEQTRGLDLFDQVVPGHADGSSRLEVSAGGLVSVDRVGVGAMFGHPFGDEQRRRHESVSLLTVPNGPNAG